jgi:hypothetical protein
MDWKDLGAVEGLLQVFILLLQGAVDDEGVVAAGREVHLGIVVPCGTGIKPRVYIRPSLSLVFNTRQEAGS